MPTKTFAFHPSTDIPSLPGKVILITGSNTGLGKHTALSLAAHSPSRIWLTARSASKGAAALAEVRALAPDGVQVSLLEMDLASFASIKAAAKTFSDTVDRLDILYLNAGLLGHPQALTEDGYEIHMGVNHVGHALLLKLLTPLLLHTASVADARVVSLTSMGWKYCPPSGIPLDKLKELVPEIPPMGRYIQSKLANKLYAREFAAEYPHITMVSVHPGEVETELVSREAGDEQVRHLQNVVHPGMAVSLEEGVKNQLWAGTSKEVVSGEYYEPVGVAEELTAAPPAVEVGGEKFESTGKEAAGGESEGSCGCGRRESWKRMRSELPVGVR